MRHTTPVARTGPVSGLPELDLDNLALLDERSEGGPVALAARENITNPPAWMLGEAPGESGRLQDATSCVVIVVESEEDSADVDAFYFYFYSYNRAANISQVLQPLKGLLEGKIDDGMNFGDHVGDW